MATAIGKTKSHWIFLQNAKFRKWIKLKRTHIMHNFHATNYD
jgi:hypothetical protein